MKRLNGKEEVFYEDDEKLLTLYTDKESLNDVMNFLERDEKVSKFSLFDANSEIKYAEVAINYYFPGYTKLVETP